MKKTLLFALFIVMALSGCATLNNNIPMSPDQTAQTFFEDLQRCDNTAAYGLLAKGISQRVSYNQFDQFMSTIRDQWGRIVSDDTELIPFHRRAGEQEFIPLGVNPKEIKRYSFDVKFDVAEMNFDLTLAPEDGKYRIVWFSVWGSSIYVNDKIQQKIKDLFLSSDDDGQ